jgi:indole-3-glycerol phosphate synthase
LVKKTVDLPVLRKDFIIDAYQIYESKLYGADIILLITRILSKQKLNEFIDLAEKLKLDVLIEFAEKNEIKKLSGFHDNMILGINNRNLNTFKVDFQNSYNLKDKLPAGMPVIAESGIQNVHDCKQLRQWGFNGVLIGETLMRASDPEDLLRTFRSGANSVNPA